MNTISKLLLALAITCASWAGLAAEPQTFFVRADTLNVRNAPISGEVVRKLGQGQEVQAYASEGVWLRISADNKPPEWVANRYLCRGAACWVPVRRSAESRYTTGKSRTSPAPTRFNTSGGCPCSGTSNCYGPRGGSYCITSGGKKRYR